YANVANQGNITITIPANTTIKGTFWIQQVEGTHVILEGADRDTSIINGRLRIAGNARYTSPETVTIKNLTFDGTGIASNAETKHPDGTVCTGDCVRDAAYLVGQYCIAEQIRYPHNVTISNCTFRNSNGMQGIKFRQGYNIKVEDCKAENMFGLFWSTGGQNDLVIDGAQVSDDCTEGITVINTADITVENSNIASKNFSIRVTLNNNPTDLKIENNILNAKTPIVLRGTSTSNQNKLTATGNHYPSLTEEEKNQVVTFDQKDGTTPDMINGEETAINTDTYKNSFAELVVPTDPSSSPTAPSMPKTGDNSQLALWVLLLGASFVGMMILQRRRAHN
ncbi:MAG: right-handed parallel beta-helix repeat-containing protein, partial [Oscillospiraceae bacterium]|nr:right-handed parallel beta-helix repeat-containing protein [Oscillospiraceae bacterium]